MYLVGIIILDNRLVSGVTWSDESVAFDKRCKRHFQTVVVVIAKVDVAEVRTVRRLRNCTEATK